MALVIGIILYSGGLFLLASVVIEIRTARKNKKVFWQHRYHRFIRVVITGLTLMTIAFIIACLD